jgi:repressor LexA
MVNDRAREILAFIQRFRREHGYPPTIREIGLEFGIKSTNGVRYHLNILERGGFVVRNEKISRGIEVAGDVGSGPDPGIPILGRVAAGQPILAEESFEGRIDLRDVFGDPNGMFALRVRGDSMIDAGIHDGDYVVVRQQNRAEAGQMVVAFDGEGATVKYFQPRSGGRIELVAANEKYPPMVFENASEFRVFGVVRGVIRTVGR